MAKLVDGDGLVFLFVVGFLDFGNEVAAVSFTSPSDDLDVFGVNANAFHGSSFLTFVLFFHFFVCFYLFHCSALLGFNTALIRL